MEKEMAEIVVIIPTYRDWQRLQLCLEALANQTIASDRFNIIVANNDPQDPCPPFGISANVRVVVEAKPGSYAARNKAVSESSSKFIAFTDSDCVPDPDWLERAIAALSVSPGARISGQVPIFRPTGGGRAAYLYEFHTAFRQREYAARGEGATANLVVPRAVFEQVGPFNDGLLSGGDFEWHRRAQALGIQMVYAHDMIVRHPSRTHIGEIFRKRRRTARSEAVFHATSTWKYVKYQVKPPIGRMTLDRGHPTWQERALLFMVMYGINLYAAYNFSLVRCGLAKAVRA